MALEHLDKALADLTDKIAALAQQHGGEAVSLASHVYQLQAIQNLILFIPTAIATGIGLAVAYFCAKKIAAAAKADELDRQVGWLIATVLSGTPTAVGIITTCVYASNLFSPLAWAAAFNPNIALAAHILGAL